MNSSSEDEIIVANKYKIAKKIGTGSFGEVYSASDIKSGKIVAIKFEKTTNRRPQLPNEARVLKLMQGQSKYYNQSDFLNSIFMVNTESKTLLLWNNLDDHLNGQPQSHQRDNYN